ncbi:BH3 interacting domain death agonist [Trachinotus anak]|uniref:BH3 interacting domain death agonist n=1 Tax=Trachinotus anak TaxID=443729 RepID=UPI0039F19F89
MDDLLNMSGGQNTALVILAFLQADCSNVEYSKELLALGTGLNLTRDINCNGPRIETLDDGDLETDGHPISSVSSSFSDIHPVVDLQWPRNHEAAAVPQQVAEELRVIADQLERSVVAQATRNLRGNISSSLCEQWNNYLSREVEWVMRHITIPQHLPQEQVIMALTLTLVKGVCQQAPRFLKNLFNTALQYIILRSAR